MDANVQEIHIVKNVRIITNAECRKELSMKDLVLQRMEQELEKYREYLVSGKITAKEMLDEAYQLVIKQGLYYIFANHNCSRLTINEWKWLNQQENILCQTAHCGRCKPHFDFGDNTFPIVPYRHLPQTLIGMTADCRSLV